MSALLTRLTNIRMHNISLLEYVKSKSIFVWGCGAFIDEVTDILNKLGINSFSYVDKDKNKYQRHQFRGREIFSPETILLKKKDEIFIFIAAGFYESVADFLLSNGLKKWEHFLDGVHLEADVYNLERFYKKNVLTIKHLENKDFDKIVEQMIAEKINIKNLIIDMDETDNFQKILEDFKMENCKNSFQQVNKKTKWNVAYRRKILEYWCAYHFLNIDEFEKNIDIYIDVGSGISPWVAWLREEKNINAYGVDLFLPETHASYYREENAIDTTFKENSVTGMSLQSSFCLFSGDDDIKFIDECYRILKPGGRVVISPLYMYTDFISAVSPEWYGKGHNNIEQMEYFRLDCCGIKMSRYYDVKHLKKRILNRITELNMKYEIAVLNNNQIPLYDIAYLKFILIIEK